MASHGFRIYFTVDVVREEDVAEVKEAVAAFVQTDSEVHESFITQLHTELESRDAAVPQNLDMLEPQSANSEVWLRGSMYFEDQEPKEPWVLGPWGPCTASCGTGFQNR